jgi:hypothetical protein
MRVPGIGTLPRVFGYGRFGHRRRMIQKPCGGFGRIGGFSPDDRLVTTVAEHRVLKSMTAFTSFDQSSSPWLKVKAQMWFSAKTAYPCVSYIILRAELISLALTEKRLYDVELAHVEKKEQKTTSHGKKR